jgi:hypothetical protein
MELRSKFVNRNLTPLKKIIFHSFFSLIVFTYVFSSVGVRLVAHYCGGSLEKISLFSKPASCCGGEEEEESSDCCHNDSKHVAFQKDFTFYMIVADYKVSVQQLFLIDHTRVSFLLRDAPQTLFLVDRQNHPPDLVQDDIVNSSVLRI